MNFKLVMTEPVRAEYPLKMKSSAAALVPRSGRSGGGDVAPAPTIPLL
jgi:hypothetical protein